MFFLVFLYFFSFPQLGYIIIKNYLKLSFDFFIGQKKLLKNYNLKIKRSINSTKEEQELPNTDIQSYKVLNIWVPCEFPRPK